MLSDAALVKRRAERSPEGPQTFIAFAAGSGSCAVGRLHEGFTSATRTPHLARLY